MSAAPTRVLVLHAYSADNAGDGLLVRETLSLLDEALGAHEATLLASRPDSFANLGVRALPTVPTIRGWDPETRKTLKNMGSFDLVVGVGGGYLRAGSLREALKAALVMGPQLRAASRTSAPTVYLPQSIGPARFGTRPWLARALRGIDTVMVRDDRSLIEVNGPTLRRVPDLATSAAAAGRQPSADVDPVPVLSIRSVRGRINPDVHQVADRISPFDSYVQSTVGGNDDRPAAATLSPRRTIERVELMSPGSTPRVVIAVRLHAALMALAAGHYVVHLAYERKGFGAFDDLGILQWAHPFNRFDAETVVAQTEAFLRDEAVRAEYDARIAAAADELQAARRSVVAELRRHAARSA